MYVSEKHRFCYFTPCKAASNTLALAFTKYYGAVGMVAEECIPGKEYAWPEGPHHSIFLPRKYEDYLTITSVRNPYHREMSKFNFLPTRNEIYEFIANMTFHEYIDWVCRGGFRGNWRYDFWRYSQKQIIFDQPLRPHYDSIPVRVDKILKVESLKEDFLKLPFVNSSNPILEAKNNYAHVLRITEFPADLVEKTYEYFREDFEMFGYDKEPPPYEFNESAAKGEYGTELHPEWVPHWSKRGWKINSTLSPEELEAITEAPEEEPTPRVKLL